MPIDIVKKLPKSVALYIFKFLYLGNDQELCRDIRDIYLYNSFIENLDKNEMQSLNLNISSYRYRDLMNSYHDYGISYYICDAIQKERNRAKKLEWNVQLYCKMHDVDLQYAFHLVKRKNEKIYLRNQLAKLTPEQRIDISPYIEIYIDV